MPAYALGVHGLVVGDVALHGALGDDISFEVLGRDRRLPCGASRRRGQLR
jgi:hypothetical protein